MLTLLGAHYWYMSIFIVLIFSYLAYSRSSAPAPFFSGPHECMECGKVIYGDNCPYCSQNEEAVAG
jgi:hypothetical protein